MTEPEHPDDPRTSWIARHGYVLAIATVFTITGAVLGPVFFPDVSAARSVLGGALFGGVCTLAAAMHRVF